VINGTIFYVAQYFGLSPAMKGFVVSVALIGCVIEPLYWKACRQIRERFILKYMALFFLDFHALNRTGRQSDHVYHWPVYRGTGCWRGSVVTPMYISEVAPPKLRAGWLRTASLPLFFEF
jgi:hypothetical protein